MWGAKELREDMLMVSASEMAGRPWRGPLLLLHVGRVRGRADEDKYQPQWMTTSCHIPAVVCLPLVVHGVVGQIMVEHADRPA